MKRYLLKSAISVALASVSVHTLASGFAINEQSVSGMGVGFAGRASVADDASTVFGNPAGMARLQREQVAGGVALLEAHSHISDASSAPGGGTNDGDMVPLAGVPMGYYVRPINDQWTVGVGMYVPFGLVADYESSFAGRYFGSKSAVEVMTLQPTVSYALNERLSIGFGPTINRVGGVLESNLSLIPMAPDGEVRVEGDDIALGYNIGLLAQLTDSTRIGLAYHSKVDYQLEGDTQVDYSLLSKLGHSAHQQYNASLDLTTPESVDLSVTHELSARWTLYASSAWTRWSRLQDISVVNSGVPSGLVGQFGKITEQQNWHDTWSHAVGASYRLSDQWVLRSGLAVDQSPTNNRDRSPRIPTGDRTTFSIGASWLLTPELTIDAAYSHLREDPVKVSSSAHGQRYSAQFENAANVFALGATFQF